MLLANSLSGLFSNHMSSLGLGSPFGGNPAGNAPVEETVINNYYGSDADQQNDNDDVQQADDDNDTDFDSGDDSSVA